MNSGTKDHVTQNEKTRKGLLPRRTNKSNNRSYKFKNIILVAIGAWLLFLLIYLFAVGIYPCFISEDKSCWFVVV